MLKIARRQAGMTIWGWLMVFILIAFFTRVVITVYPMLYNHYKVTQHLRQIAGDPATRKMAPPEIVKSLMKRFDIDNVEYIGDKQIKITESNEGRNLTIAIPYETRAHFYGPIYILGDFTDTKAEVTGR